MRSFWDSDSLLAYIELLIVFFYWTNMYFVHNCTFCGHGIVCLTCQDL